MVTHEGRVIYKVNQDRGLISHPSLNRARHTVFGVFDGKHIQHPGFLFGFEFLLLKRRSSCRRWWWSWHPS